MTDNKLIQVKYDGVTIEYAEGTNEWVFELRGRMRRVESLAKAKEIIDRPVKEKTKPFTPIPVLKHSYDFNFEPMTVTSLADNRYGSPSVWVSAGGKRFKEYMNNMMLDTPGNREKLATITELKTKRNALVKQMEELVKSLERLTVEGMNVDPE